MTVNIIDFEQGSASADSLYNVRSGYIRANMAEFVNISANSTTGNELQVELLGYSDINSNSIFDLRWYDLTHIFDTSNRSSAKYLKIVLKYKNGSKITPEEISGCTLAINYSWYMDTNSDLHCYDMPYAPEKNMSKPYPSALWRIDYVSPNMPYHELFPNISPIHVKSVPQYDYIIVYDKNTAQDGFNNNGLAVLEPISCTVTENFNASWTVTLEHPVDREQKWKYIKEFNILKVLDQLFIIKKTEHSWTGNSGKITAYAEHIFYFLNDLWIFKGADIYAETGYWLVKSILDHADSKYQSGHIVYNFNFYSDITSETIGFDMPSIAYYKWNPLQNAMTPLEMLLGSDGFTANFGGDLYRDNFYFSINQKMEHALYNSFDIYVGLNLRGIRRTVDTSSLCTHFTAYDKFGSGVSVAWSSHGGVSHYIVRSQEFTFGENYTESNMDLIGYEAKKYFGQHMEPQIDIRVDLEDVKHNPEYSEFVNNPRYKVGDRGRIYDERLGIFQDAFISNTVKDGITGKNLEITFSSTSGFTNMGDYDISVEEIPITPEKPEKPENPENPDET